MNRKINSDIKVGCCGINYFTPKAIFGESWKDRFRSRIEAYGSLFKVLEIDSTFYALPSKRLVDNLARYSRDYNIEIILKAPRYITHIFRFNEKSYKYLDAIENASKAINSNKILFQTPESFHIKEENKERVEKLLERCRDDGFKPIFEPRGDWLEKIKETEEFCKGLAILCTDPLRKVHELDQEFNYFRLHGFGKTMMYNYRFSREELIRVIDIVKRYRSKSYVMFNNVYMYENAFEFINLIKERLD
ncbi:MAG: hypothetical protein ARM1_0654 [Candidatus Micrarchaeota archaeon]|nr:MAG: hypothetical protein ARM1_0654 [Candidatus Micrarchaeota archaeon]